MIKLVIAAVILVVIMITFVFILFKNIIKRIDDNAKKFFVNKMQNYDYILEEKQEKLNELNKQIEDLEHSNPLATIDQQENYIEERKSSTYVNVDKINYDLKVPQYRETQFFKNYKEIKKIFSVNNEQIIKDFIAEHKNEKEIRDYKKLKKIREKFDDNSIYGCLTLDSESQKEILQEALTDAEKKLVNIKQFIEMPEFNIKSFINNIEERLEAIEPTIYVYTNGNSNGYEELDENIVIEHYNNMSEGIIIKYRNKIYDYSI